MSLPTTELKDRLRKIMSLRNVKPIELSQSTGIPKSAISQYMSGYTKPKQDRIYMICKYLNISEAWLLGYDVPMERIENDNVSNSGLKLLNELSNNLVNTKGSISQIGISLLQSFDKLNDKGKQKVIDYTNDLTNNLLYIKDNTELLNAAHAKLNATDEEKQYDENIMDDENF